MPGVSFPYCLAWVVRGFKPPVGSQVGDLRLVTGPGGAGRLLLWQQMGALFMGSLPWTLSPSTLWLSLEACLGLGLGNQGDRVCPSPSQLLPVT